eukprot:3385952-Rhodomonas_salina.2
MLVSSFALARSPALLLRSLLLTLLHRPPPLAPRMDLGGPTSAGTRRGPASSGSRVGVGGQAAVPRGDQAEAEPDPGVERGPRQAGPPPSLSAFSPGACAAWLAEGCRLRAAGSRLQGWFRVQGAGCRVQGAGCRVQVRAESRVQTVLFRPRARESVSPTVCRMRCVRACAQDAEIAEGFMRVSKTVIHAAKKSDKL